MCSRCYCYSWLWCSCTVYPSLLLVVAAVLWRRCRRCSSVATVSRILLDKPCASLVLSSSLLASPSFLILLSLLILTPYSFLWSILIVSIFGWEFMIWLWIVIVSCVLLLRMLNLWFDCVLKSWMDVAVLDDYMKVLIGWFYSRNIYDTVRLSIYQES